MFNHSSRLAFARRPFALASGIAMAGALVLMGSTQVLAATAGGSQTVTGSTPAGVLSVTAPGAMSLPSLVDGSYTAATNLGSLGFTNTINTATAWNVTLAATDLYFAAGATSHINFTNFTITVDQAPTGNALNSGTVTSGAASQALTGADTTPGTTYSGPITLASGDTLASGTWTQAANKIAVGVPANTILGTSFTATVQYTITG